MLILSKTGCFLGDPGGTYPQKHTLVPTHPPPTVYFMDTKLIKWNNGATQVDKSRANSDNSVNHRYLDLWIPMRITRFKKDQLARYSLK